MRYKSRYDCRYGLPHDLKILHENPQIKVEVCQICSKKFRWNKGYKGRTDNKHYLELHARNFCQQFGTTKRIYMKIYQPEKCIIKL